MLRLTKKLLRRLSMRGQKIYQCEIMHCPPGAAASLRDSRACQPKPNSLFNQLETMARHLRPAGQPTCLRPEGRKRIAQWRTGNCHQSGKRVPQLKDEKNR